jgi:hypothetical protein
MPRLVFFSALLLFASVHVAKAQSKPTSSEIPACNTRERKALVAQAKLFLTIDRTSYSLKDKMIVDVGLRNDGENDIYVYSKNGWSFNGFMLYFKDNAGKFADPTFIDHVPPAPEKDPDDPTLFVRLRTDDFLGSRAHVALKGFIKSPGKYTLRIAYTSPALCGIYDPKIQALPTLWHHDPAIYSNIVSFEVAP